MNPLPQSSVRGYRHLVAAADHLAARAGDQIFARGGNAVDAAIATNAAIAVTGPHLCGMGGDLFALISTPDGVVALNSSGRAGSGADPSVLRSAGHTVMPLRHDINTVTVPGCVDGWVALHERFGSMPLADLLAPAIDLAEQGFPTSPLLIGALTPTDRAGLSNLAELASQATHVGARVRRPGVARAMRSIIDGGRDAFYLGEFGDGLLGLGDGLFTTSDLTRSNADWVAPLTSAAFGVDLHTIPPNSQGYLTLAGAIIADDLDLGDPGSERWAHLLIESARVAGHDRPAVLHEHADGDALLDMVRSRRGTLSLDRAGSGTAPGGAGDTTYLCTAEAGGMAVSLIQSNASGFGSWLVEPSTQINLHNRGLGFSLQAGHPAEFGPGRRPPHTLSPAMATRGNELVSVFGTMGGDAQPQILLQIAARLFAHGQSPAAAVNAPRWALAGPRTGFDTWDDLTTQSVDVEGHAPEDWLSGLAARGHRVNRLDAWDSTFGHAQAIVREAEGLVGAADPRTRVGAVIGR
ncbi:MAG: gamma-glutamyltransferase [Actinomycetota bacterium]|nr:gamma-glutamyltransferase [Actinomycetota bacterium]